MKIYLVMCSNDGEPQVAFTTKIAAWNYAGEFNSVAFYRMEVVEIELREDN